MYTFRFPKMRLIHSVFAIASCSTVKESNDEIPALLSVLPVSESTGTVAERIEYFNLLNDKRAETTIDDLDELEDVTVNESLADESSVFVHMEELDNLFTLKVDEKSPAPVESDSSRRLKETFVPIIDALFPSNDESGVYRTSTIGIDGDFVTAPEGFTGTSTYELFKRGLSRTDVRGPKVGSFGLKTEGDDKYMWLTYEDMDTQSRLFANGLVELGLVEPIDDTRGQTWRFLGIYSEHRFHWTVTELAASRQNITLIPIYDTSKPDFVVSIIEQTKLATIVVSMNRAISFLQLVRDGLVASVSTIILIGSEFDRLELYSKFPHLRISIITAAEVKGAGMTGLSDNLPALDDVNTICFTSGTTGEPKGVLVTHKMLISVVGAAMKANLGLNFKDIHLAYLPPAHIFERILDLAFMYVGAKIGYHSGDMKQLADSLRKVRPTVLAGVPRVFDNSIERVKANIAAASPKKQAMISKAMERSGHIISSGKVGIKKLGLVDKFIINKLRAALGGRVRIILSGGGALSPATQDILAAAFHVPVLQGYGMTETTGGTLLTQVRSGMLGVVGLPLACVEVKLANMVHHSEFHGAGAGELYVRGPAVFTGYFGKPAETALTDDGWVKTGDVAKLLVSETESAFQIVGRAKEMFKLEHGEYVVPAFVEQEYKKCDLVDEIFVDSSIDNKATVAIVNLKETEIYKAITELGLSMSKSDAVKSGELNKHVMSCLRKAEQNLNNMIRIRSLHISETYFGAETEFQTATMKFKREVIRKYFANEISKL